MPCPLFLPASPLVGFTTEASSLGDVYGGECGAQPGALIPIDTLRSCCNRGYARATCTHAARSESDAFRFLIKSDRGGLIGVAWSIERDHHPVAVGTFSLGTSPVSNTAVAEGPLELQARACAAAYRRQSRV